MKTRNLLLTVSLGLFGFLGFGQEFTADLNKTTLGWYAAKVTGEHNGYIQLKSGTILLGENKIESGTFIIDMTSITNEDIASEEYNKKLVDHLKSDDFFGIATYPEAKLVITKSSKFKDNQAEITADLTLKGKTHPVVFTAVRNGNNFTAKITVDRSKYDVRYGSKSFFDGLGDKMIYDEFTLTVNMKMISKKAS